MSPDSSSSIPPSSSIASPDLEFWIPGAIPTPNQVWRMVPVKPRQKGPSRWSVVQDMRQRAQVVALVHAKRRRFSPPIRVVFTMLRRRLLDEGDVAAYALKAYRDGIINALVPGSNDGPRSGNRFEYQPQQQVSRTEEEGVLVQVFQEVRAAEVPSRSGQERFPGIPAAARRDP